jgi:hypothetical protein
MDGRRPAFTRVHRTRPTGRLAPHTGPGLGWHGHRAPSSVPVPPEPRRGPSRRRRGRDPRSRGTGARRCPLSRRSSHHDPAALPGARLPGALPGRPPTGPAPATRTAPMACRARRSTRRRDRGRASQAPGRTRPAAGEATMITGTERRQRERVGGDARRASGAVSRPRLAGVGDLKLGHSLPVSPVLSGGSATPTNWASWSLDRDVSVWQIIGEESAG